MSLRIHVQVPSPAVLPRIALYRIRAFRIVLNLNICNSYFKILPIRILTVFYVAVNIFIHAAIPVRKLRHVANLPLVIIIRLTDDKACAVSVNLCAVDLQNHMKIDPLASLRKKFCQSLPVQRDAVILIDGIVSASRIQPVRYVIRFFIPASGEPFDLAVLRQFVIVNRDRQILIRVYPRMISAAQIVSIQPDVIAQLVEIIISAAAIFPALVSGFVKLDFSILIINPALRDQRKICAARADSSQRRDQLIFCAFYDLPYVSRIAVLIRLPAHQDHTVIRIMRNIPCLAVHVVFHELQAVVHVDRLADARIIIPCYREDIDVLPAHSCIEILLSYSNVADICPDRDINILRKRIFFQRSYLYLISIDNLYYRILRSV